MSTIARLAVRTAFSCPPFSCPPTVFKILSCFLLTGLVFGGAAADEQPADRSGRFGANSSFRFRLSTLEGEEVLVSAADSARVTVVCFLGTECPLVKLYAARLSMYSDLFARRGVRFVGVNSNRQDEPEDIRAYLAEHPLSFPMVRDENNAVADAYEATRTPEVFVLDAEMKLRYRGRVDDQYEPGISRNAATRDDMKLAIEEVLAGEAVTIAVTEPTGCMIGKVRRSATVAPSVAASVTFCNQVSRLLRKHCIECHRTGEIGPFSMEKYEDVVGWADTSLEVIANGRMPPWHADSNHGSFANARHMPDSDKQILKDWVASGMPEGQQSDLPQAIKYTDGWQLSKTPDMVIPMRDRPYAIPAEGTVEYQYFVVDPKFTEDQWVTGAQVIPGNRSVVHHAIVFIRPPDGSEFRGVGWLTAYVPGQRLSPVPKGYARKIPAGSKLVFQMHYTTNGAEHEDISQVGIVFGKADEVTHELITLIAIDQEFEIPPQAPNHEVSGEVRWFPENGLLLSVAPHMHFRGKSFQLFADRASHAETLLHVPRYDFNWQHSYEFTDARPLSEIDRLRFTAAFDNSSGNPVNPDPSEWVTWGDQTWEEMAVAFLEVAEPLRPTSPEATAASNAQVEPRAISPDREHRIQKFVDDFFGRLDTNADGVVLRAEVPISVRNTFWRFDHDGDLKADRVEVRKIAEARIQN